MYIYIKYMYITNIGSVSFIYYRIHIYYCVTHEGCVCKYIYVTNINILCLVLVFLVFLSALHPGVL